MAARRWRVWIKRAFHPPIRAHKNQDIFFRPHSDQKWSILGADCRVPPHQLLFFYLSVPLFLSGFVEQPPKSFPISSPLYSKSSSGCWDWSLGFAFNFLSSMAVSSSLATSFAGVKFQTLVFCNSSSSLAASTRSSHSQIRILYEPSKRGLVKRGLSLNPRAELLSDVDVRKVNEVVDLNKSPSLSALEQLKTSAADRKLNI